MRKMDLNNKIYQNNIRTAAALPLPWEQLKNKSVMIAGATGLIGRCMIDLLMYKNQNEGLNCQIYAISRNEKSARERLQENYFNSEQFMFLRHDVCVPFNLAGISSVDYVIHLASKTHPVAYATEPIDTILTNIYGLKNLLDFAENCHTKRFVFLSSVEIYGENCDDVERFTEDYNGYLNSNTVRAGYPESKRCGESLCQAYIAEKGMDIVIPRLPRIYGPTMLKEDSKALAQFFKKAVYRQDIVLTSKGDQQYSFLHVIDAVSGVLTVMLKGRKGEAYNIADSENDATLKDMAEMLAEIAGTSVVYDLPDEIEQRGYSTATKAMLDGTKIRKLGWRPLFTAEEGIQNTLDSMMEGKV